MEQLHDNGKGQQCYWATAKTQVFHIYIPSCAWQSHSQQDEHGTATLQILILHKTSSNYLKIKKKNFQWGELT